MPLLFGATLFLSAVLLFLVQPLVGKLLLPMLGGTPAVWNTCMVFFQAALLLGYLYAHLLVGRLGPRRSVFVHLLVLAVPVAAFAATVSAGGVPFLGLRDVPPDAAAEAEPIPWLLWKLTVYVGVPFFAIATTAPLLQRWFADTGHPSAGDPYFLYAASNAGSLLGLFAFPFVLEPAVPLAANALGWAAGYAGLTAAVAACGVALRRAPVTSAVAADAVEPGPTWGRRATWVFLAFVPSSLLLGVTTYLTTDIASIPLFWVTPLALYLLTFIFAFGSRPPLTADRVGRLLGMAAVLMAVLLIGRVTNPLGLLIPVHLAAFFLAGWACHAALAADRPAPAHLTAFFLWVSVGGVLGGLFNTFVAPTIFSRFGIVEYPLMLVAACFVRRAGDAADGALTSRSLPAGGRDRRVARDLGIAAAVGGLVVVLGVIGLRAGLAAGPLRTALLFGLPAVIVFAVADRRRGFGLALAALLAAGTFAVPTGETTHLTERNFFGLVRVMDDPRAGVRLFVHGNTVHGAQYLDPARALDPLAYHYPGGGIDEVFRAYRAGNRPNTVAVAGLGAGVLAAYAKPGEKWVFWDIDPAVIRIAADPALFTFLSKAFADDPARTSRPAGSSGESSGRVRLVLADARLGIAREPDAGFGLIVMEAFSSDAIPVHLLTREAIGLYLRKLAPGGLIAFNVSNRYMELAPVLADLAADLGLAFRFRDDSMLTPEQKKDGKFPSQWVVLARADADLGPLATDPNWRPASPDRGPVWTDDYSNVLRAIRR